MVSHLGSHMELETLVACLDGQDAEGLHAILKQAGFECFLSPSNQLSRKGTKAFDVLVRTKDMLGAKTVMSRVSVMPRGTAKLDADGELLYCALCGSDHVHAYQGQIPTIIPSISRTAEPSAGWYHCLTCDGYYNNKPSRYKSLPFGLMYGSILAAFTLLVIWLIEWLRFNV